jgi:hypothetical protein
MKALGYDNGPKKPASKGKGNAPCALRTQQVLSPATPLLSAAEYPVFSTPGIKAVLRR